MAKRKSSSFLPKFLQTNKNAKFLHATLDQLLNSKSLERIDGYVGRRRGPSYAYTDPYVETVGKNRQHYQLEPSTVYKKNGEIEFVVTYDDLISSIASNGGNNTRHDRLFEQEYYNWSGFTDYDKLINFGEYYWLPAGPGTVNVSANEIPVSIDFDVSKATDNDYYNLSPTYGDANNPIIYLTRGGEYTFTVDQDSSFWIQTEPGTSGNSSISFNRSTRDVFGVTNNGTNNGTITFNVPQAQAQDFYTKTLTNVSNVDLASDVTYNDLNGTDYQAIQEAGGIDGQYYLENKTIIFTHSVDDDTAWPAGMAEETKYSIYRVLVTSANIIQLLAIQPLSVNDKVQIQEGELHSTKEYFRSTQYNSLQVVPTITAPISTFYYQDGTDSTRYGIIKILDSDYKLIDLEEQVLGQKTYTSPNGVKFTNGMHIRFDTTVTPTMYQNNTYIVDGVGESIVLVSKDEHEAYELTNIQTKDYITIRRGSLDKNAWSRSNHWYHRNVVEIISDLNNVLPVLDQTQRANRPIIEFNRNQLLYNHGVYGKPPVDVVDTSTTDVLSNIQNVRGFIVDGVQLSEGMRVIFTADANIEVRNKIWTVEIVDFDDDSNTEVRLVGNEDVVVDGDSVVIKSGTRSGDSYYWKDENWILAQRKTLINQSPMFDVFDSNGISYGDNSVYVSSNFKGSKLFSYAIGSGNVDNELGFALKYRNFNNIGDIIFSNDYSTDIFNFTTTSGSTSKQVNTGFIKISNMDKSINYIDGWRKVNTNSTQYQEIQYFANGTSKQFDIGTLPKETNTSQPNLIVYFGSVEQKSGYEYKFDNNMHVVEFETAPIQGTQIIFEVLSDFLSPYGTYQIPVNLSNNSFNASFDSITLGQMRNHIGEVLKTAEGFDGVYPGRGNLRDVIDSTQYPGNILHHSAGLTLPCIFLQHNHLNSIDSIEFNLNEYTKFKQKFMQAAQNIDIDSTDIPEAVDTILASINSTKSASFPFYHSDMVAHGTNKKIRQYTVTDDRQTGYQFESIYILNNNTSRSVLVYRNNTQLVHGTDYTFANDRASVYFTAGLLQIGDVVKIVDYPATTGNFIPPTPSKLGLYPKYQPKKYTDNTYINPVEMIQGHDGSITRCYGGFLDDILLELEKRIYNNIKAIYKPDVFDINSILPGRWRDTGYSNSEKNNVISKFFLKWAIKNRIDWTTHTDYDFSNKFTWNYNELNDKLDDTLLPGGWRGIYNYYYDTDRPHLAPWEMLGFSEEPSWWQDRYGPAPYTNGNLVLWEDLRDGKVYNSAGEFTVNQNYKRPDLLEMIPVNAHGALKAPWDTLATGSIVVEQDNNWTLNDFGPAQSAWMKSSDWPFIAQIMCALMKPAKYFSLCYDTDSNIRSSLTGNIVNILTNKQTQRSDIIIPFVDQNLVNGYSTYIANYMQFLGMDVAELKDVIQKVDINLATKLSAYTDKKFLKVLAEQVSPNAVSENVTIPDEDYNLFVTKTGPIINAPYSGVIVQRTNGGYSVYGYDVTNPFFRVIPSIQSNRVNVHEVQGDRYFEYLDAGTDVLTIPYGTELKTPQHVFDFLIGYGRYLKLLGYDFDSSTSELGSDLVTANWAMSGKEFAYWNRQNWGIGAVVSLSPSADYLKFQRFDGMIDSLVNEYSGKSVLNQNFDTLTTDNYRTLRQDGEFSIQPTPDSGGIYFADLKVVQYEHVLVLNNETIFNDIVYQPELGNRQNRLRLVGWRTQGWDGSLTAQGFILNRGIVDSWVQNTDYSKGAIIKYNNKLYTASKKHTSGLTFEYSQWVPTEGFKLGLLPNWDTLGGNFESYYNIDDVSLDDDANKLGNSVIGYQSRNYLANLGLDDTSQVKFYQGLIKEKGTPNSINKLLRARLDNTTSDIDLYEEWAVRVGEYGGLDINRRVEVEILENDINGNPFVIHGTPSIEDNLEGVKNVVPSQFYKAHPETKHNWIPKYDTPGLQGDVLPYAGYAKLTDADATLFDITLYQNLDSQLANMKIGYILYTANDLQKDWNIYYLDIAPEVVTSAQASDNDTILWTTKENHNLQDGDLIVIKDFGEASGVHQVLRSTGLKGFETLEKVEGLDISGEASVLKFNSVRFADEVELSGYSPRRGWQLEDRVFLDNYENKWTVLEKKQEHVTSRSIIPSVYSYQDGNFGGAFSINTEKSLGAFAMPSVSAGTIAIYTPNIQGDLSESLQLVPDLATVQEFGTDVDVHDTLIAVGAPGTNSAEGAVFIYSLSKDDFNFNVRLAWSIPGTSGLGTKVKFSKDGNRLFVTAPGEHAVYYFKRYSDNNTPVSIVDRISADGVKTVFPCKVELTGKSVAVEGVVQIEGLHYNTSNGNIVFTSPPTISSAITVLDGPGFRYVGRIGGPSLAGFGSSIDVNLNGTTIVVGAPNETITHADEGAAYIYTEDSIDTPTADDDSVITADVTDTTTDSFDPGWTQTQKLTSVISNEGSVYGTDVAILDDSSKVFVSAPGADRLQNASGLVSVHKFNTDTSVWDFQQNITRNASIDGQRFGSAIAVNSTGSTVAISAPDDTYDAKTIFDDDETQVDSNATQFYDKIDRGGNVYVYQGFGDSFVQTQKLTNTSITIDDKFGTELQINDSTIYVGVPLDDGVSTQNSGSVFEYSVTGVPFEVVEQEDTLVDYSRINRVFLYDNIKNELIDHYDWIDPIKGKIPGIAEENIDYKTLWDPAVYANENSDTWGPKQVGKIWWNLSTVKYVYAEQGDWAYRSSFWGSVFPGSSIDVYQWVESKVPPAEYEGTGVVYDSNLFNSVTVYKGSVLDTTYYYWVKNIREIGENHTLSAYNIANVIVDPKTYGIPYVAFTSDTDIVAYNLKNNIIDKQTVLVVDYDVEQNDQLLHTEWAIIREDYANEVIPSNIRRKIVDSLVGADSVGNTVPDTNLRYANSHGTMFRPRQSMFVNRFNALEVFVSTANTVLQKYPIAVNRNINSLFEEDPEPTIISGEWNQRVDNKKQLGFVRISERPTGWRVLVSADEDIQNLWTIYESLPDNTWTLVKLQSYDVKTQWNYSDWYATGFDNTTYVNYSIPLTKDLVDIEIKTGETVKVENGGNWELLYYNGVEYTTVGIKNGTIQLATSLYDYTARRYGFDSEVFDFQLFDQEPQIETRKIINAIIENIFVDDLRIEWNKIFQALLYHILDEQPYVDWLFKTSFVSVNHKIRALDALPYYRRDNQDYVEEFIKEAKPYHTKIREYVLNYDKTDPWDGDVTDFDVHSYYDSELQLYRKPNGDDELDDQRLAIGVNSPYNDYKTFGVESIYLYNSGSGYIIPPTVTITGGNGAGATAIAVLDGGSVSRIDVTNPGSGYTETPSVKISSGTGVTAIGYARLSNDQIRTFETKLKFDRVRFTTDVVDWKPNTVYTVDQLISYQGEAYRAIEDFTSGDTFTSDSLTIILDEYFDNAMDRAIAYYQPSDIQPAKQLENLFYGIEYPRNKVTGAGFEKEPGFGRAGYDGVPFDNFEIGPEGLPVISGVVDTNITASNIPITGAELEAGAYVDFDFVETGYSENQTVLVEGVTVAQVLQNRFGDALLGTRPEDIEVVGGKFVDQYSSHAPEEFIPGRVFDSLDIEVYQSPSSTFNNEGLSPKIEVVKHAADGSTTRFSFMSQDNTHAMNLMLYTQVTGKVQPDEYTVDWSTFEVVFNTAPIAGDIVDIISIGNTGENLVLDIVYTADGLDSTFILPVSASLAKQSLVLVDGIKTSHVITDENQRAVVNTTVPPVNGSHVHIFVFNLDPSVEVAYSHVAQESFTVDGSTRVLQLEQTPFYDAPTDAKVFVELAEVRLRPNVYTYAVGDGSTTTYTLTTDADTDHRTITDSDIVVYINGASNTNWTLDADDGSSARTITFTTPPLSGATITIGDTTNAEFTIVNNIITLDNSLTLVSGTKLNVTSFSNHNALKMSAETFVGLASDELVIPLGYDRDLFDSQAFDTPTIAIINTPLFDLYRTPTNVNYLWVTLNGIKLSVNSDYGIENGKLLIKRNIQSSDVLVVNQFTENTIKQRISWRMWKDILGNTHFYRMIDDATTELVEDLAKNDNQIVVKNGSKLAEPNLETNIPGVVFIGYERITYWEKDGNTLKNIRRGTMGTASPFKHYKGSQIIDASKRQEVPNFTNSNVWYDMTQDEYSLQYQTTQQANFLNAFKGTSPLINISYDQSGAYIQAGYVQENYVEINE